MIGRTGKIRNIFLVWLVWPLITLGIYHLVWYYKINRESHDFDGRIEVNPVVSVLAMTLGWLVLIPPFVSVYNTGRRISRMQQAAGLPGGCNPWIGVILLCVAGLYPLYYQHELNQIWIRYGSLAEGSDVTLAA
ncbi:hypothetical protein ACZ90_18290 [Streptomyces albus subsp. albus]|nr:hypothetical protein ACZ90_18290 [Streptomyces albus subsp. albus]